MPGVVTVDGINSTVATLRAMDRTLLLQFNRQLRAAANSVRGAARGLAPRRTGALASGIVVRKGRSTATSTGWRIQSTTRQGAILEFAAQGRSNQGRSLVATLTARYGSPGRVVWRAWDAQAARAYTAIAAAVRAAEAQINADLGRAG